MTTNIKVALYGVNVNPTILKSPWLPSSGSYPSSTNAGYIYIAGDNGTVSGTAYVSGEAIIYENGSWKKLGSIFDSSDTVNFKGDWDASSSLFPVGAATDDMYRVSVQGNVGSPSETFYVDDVIIKTTTDWIHLARPRISSEIPNDSTVSGATVTDALQTLDGDIGTLQTNKQDVSEKAQPSGYASLDTSGQVPFAQIPLLYTGDIAADLNSPPTMLDDVITALTSRFQQVTLTGGQELDDCFNVVSTTGATGITIQCTIPATAGKGFGIIRTFAGSVTVGISGSTYVIYDGRDYYSTTINLKPYNLYWVSSNPTTGYYYITTIPVSLTNGQMDAFFGHVVSIQSSNTVNLYGNYTSYEIRPGNIGVLTNTTQNIALSFAEPGFGTQMISRAPLFFKTPDTSHTITTTTFNYTGLYGYEVFIDGVQQTLPVVSYAFERNTWYSVNYDYESGGTWVDGMFRVWVNKLSGNITSSSANTADTVVYRDSSGNFAANDITVNSVNVANGIVLDKTAGEGFKVDNTTPTFPWYDLLGNITSEGGANSPNFVTYRNGIKQYQFALNDEVFLEFHLTHDYVPGTDMFIHAHWSHISAAVTSGDVTWSFEATYSKGHLQGADSVFGATKTVSVTQAASTTQYEHHIAEVQLSAPGGSVTQLDSSKFEPDGIILVRLYLSANTISAATDPFCHFADIHYQSTGIGTKQKAPNFYS